MSTSTDRGIITKLMDDFRSWQYERIKRKCEDRKGLKLRVRVTNHKILTDYIYPDRSKRAWDFDTYYNANLYLIGKANPIKLDGSDTNRNLMPSQKYRSYMQNKLVSDIMESHQESNIEKLLTALIFVSLAALGGVLFLIMEMMGLI